MAVRNPLDDFCSYALKKCCRKEDPVKLGDLFREYAKIRSTPSLRRTIELARSLGIKVAAASYLDTGGTNMKAEGVWHIHYSSRDRPATQKFDILHELFEVIYKNRDRWDLNYDQDRIKDLRLCRLADRFAAAVLIPPRFFLERVQATGCDLVDLGEELELSHQCLLIALGQHYQDIPLIGALYELNPQTATGASSDPKHYKATVVVKTRPASHAKELCMMQKVPVRNSQPHIGSLVCAAITGGLPLLWRSSRLDDGPIIFIRPLFTIAGGPYRVILLALPGEESSLIAAQVEKVEPVPVEEESLCPSQKKCFIPGECIWRNGGYHEPDY